MAKVLGVGGVFFKSRDGDAMRVAYAPMGEMWRAARRLPAGGAE